MADPFLHGVRDGRLERPDGRIVAWSEFGPEDGLPLLRVPGTPGSRYSMRADRTAWAERNVRAITTERPGFGASTRLPGRGFRQIADDYAAILDHLELGAVHVWGGSGAAPHELALAARHPDRVRAVTILVGAAPFHDDEAAQMIGVNAEGYRLVRAGDIDGLRALLEPLLEASVEDPTAAILAIMDQAPEADRAVMADPFWQAGHTVSTREAFKQGVEGWIDETVAIIQPWDDIDLSAVRTSVTWWHAPSDANAPMSAALRLVATLPNARMEWFGEDEGHMAHYHREGEILDELFARG
jgi:pimeloyl-ACP methyl ester carboxylesterase